MSELSKVMWICSIARNIHSISGQVYLYFIYTIQTFYVYLSDSFLDLYINCIMGEKQLLSVHNYTLEDISKDTGRAIPAKEFHIFTYEELTPNEKMTERPIRSDHFVFGLVLNGEATVRLSLIDYKLKKNDLFIIRHGVIHQLNRGNEKFSMIGMGFSRDFIGASGIPPKYVSLFDFLGSQNNPHYCLSEKDVSTLHKLLLLLREKDLDQEDQPFRTELINHGFSMFMLEFATIVKRQSIITNTRLTRKEDITMSFIRLLHIHFKEERSVRFYANALFVTARHLTKTLKEVTDKTGGELIDDMVITEAKILLDDLSIPIRAVAEALNFNDQYIFSKFFKNITGITPSDYRSSI